jgi:hypothetical protein
MIIIKLQGGLGNQMFQYAIGRRLSIYHNASLKFDVGFYPDIKQLKSPNEKMQDNFLMQKMTPRSFQLNFFKTQIEFASQDDINYSFKTGLFSKIKQLMGKQTYIEEISCRFILDYLKFGKNCYLNGFWQSENYFAEIEEILRKEFELKKPLEGDNLSMTAKIRSVNAVSIHVRRGDYVSDSLTYQFHGVCSLDYYEKAIQYFQAKLNEPHFFIFSDDLQWVKQNFFINQSFSLVDINDEENGYKDMYLMSQCKHHIIANSSFSWWAAWLNSCKNKIVIAPKKWFNDTATDDSAILPSKWLKF